MNSLRIHIHKSMSAHPDHFFGFVLAGEPFSDLDIGIKSNNIFVAPKSKKLNCRENPQKGT